MLSTNIDHERHTLPVEVIEHVVECLIWDLQTS